MNIKQKLTWAFVAIACLPILLVAAVVIYNLRAQAEATFLDGSSREIRQIENAMNMFFKGISESVDYVAALPPLVAAPDLKNYSSENAPSVPLPEANRELEDLFEQFAKQVLGEELSVDETRVASDLIEQALKKVSAI